MKILVATHNGGKLREILEVVGDLPAEFVSLKDIGISEDVEETGATHEENALLKAKFYHSKTGLPTIGEDSGIYVDAFPGDFGVYTRRWKGLHAAGDDEWIRVFLEEIAKIQPEKRTARFVCCAAYYPGAAAQPIMVRGETTGIITAELRAPLIPGIPISSCFIPDGYSQVYAALTVSQKNVVSHRGKALSELKQKLAVIEQIGV